jgi:hypothetical protein
MDRTRDAQDLGELGLRPSRMRLRPGVVVGRVTDLAEAIDHVEALVIRTREEVRLWMTLRWVQQSIVDAQAAHTRAGGARVDALLDASVGWGVAVARAIASALSYRTPQQRRTAMALAAEESEMRLIMAA